MNKRCSLGIDTSNYKTSVAIVDEQGQIICNFQQYLNVKKGERGLRQSDALFQHVNNLPVLMEKAFAQLPADYSVGCVSVSSKPRPVEGSYMPVFNAGVSTGRALAAALRVPYYEFSHQEGHIEAVKFYSPLKETENLLSFHFSGGTTEALLIGREEDGHAKIDIIGGSKDLAFGQVLDRVGVAMGMEFPCGEEMDRIASEFDGCAAGGFDAKKDNLLPKIKCQDGSINLSGLETKCQRTVGTVENEKLIVMLFYRAGEAIAAMTRQLCETQQLRDVLFAGGVSSSKYIRRYLAETLKDLNICFGDPALSTDNAVGTALLGGRKLWL